MLQVRVDGEGFAGADRAGSVIDLLNVVEPALATQSRIVTAFRVNGVEEPAFREPGVRTRTLQAGDRIDLETTPSRQLATDALTDAARLMPSLCAAATQIADQFRAGETEAAARELGPLAEGLTLIVTLLQAAEAWADAACLTRDSWMGTDVVSVARCIEALEGAQRDRDWVSAADLLAYDLAPALEAWGGRLHEALLSLVSVGAEAHAAEA